MKLAEGLQLRADTQKRMQQLRQRMNMNATYQEGDKPAEDPVVLMEEYESCVRLLEELVAHINRTNSETVTPQGSLTELLAKRDSLKLLTEAYREFLHAASNLSARATRSEIRIVSAVDVPVYRKKADDYARQLRELDNVIQSANWTTELK